MLEVRLLGRFDVRRDGANLAITSRPAQSLFAYLILSAGTSHRREKLAGMLWPDSLEETARDNLRHALWRVRKALPIKPKVEYLLADDLSIAFNASSEYWLDAAELEKLNENASADELMAVLSEYQGELLPGFYDEWVMLEREHLYSIFEHHMARLMSLLQNEKRWLDILDWGERWIKLGQKPEPAYRALMTAHAAKGDMSKVAATYERCVKSLKEFGIEPSEQTKELYEKLKSGKAAPGTETDSKKPLIKEASSTIPVPLTSFIGREKELKEVARLLSSSRLLTLTGSGGVGKTRLAIQTANDSIRKFKDGVVWVGLVGLSDGNLIPQEIAQSLNVREVSNVLLIETLKTYLKSKDVLLVIDNCEHLIKACAQYVEQLLAACPKLKVLATSIEALGLFNETIWQVPSLPVPELQQLSLQDLKDFASIELFHERARHAKSGFALDERNMSSVAQICHRLDGIPLAIELAAARIKVLSVDEIAARLDDRFSLLTAGSRTAIPRHQTLRATIDWSYDLLTEAERILLCRLAVFAGGFTLEAAESVCSKGMKRSDILDLLGRLVDKSLVMVDTSARGHTRYRLLETMREYAFMKLSEAEEVDLIRDSHLDFFMRLTESIAPEYFPSAHLKWFELLEMELNNLYSAMKWSIRQNNDEGTDVMKWRYEAGLRLVGGLEWFWQRKNTGRAIISLKNMLARGSTRTLGRARALNALGLLHWSTSNFSEGRACLEEALIISRGLDDRVTLAWSLAYLGSVAGGQGDYDFARSCLEEGLAIAQILGTPGRPIVVLSLLNLGDVYISMGHYDQARPIYEEAVRLTREMGDSIWVGFIGYLMRRLGYAALHLGDITNVKEFFEETLLLSRGSPDKFAIPACLAAFAALDLAHAREVRAAQLCGAVENLLDAMSLQLFYLDQAEYDQTVAKLRSRMGSKTLVKAWMKGAAMSLEEAIGFALEET